MPSRLGFAYDPFPTNCYSKLRIAPFLSTYGTHYTPFILQQYSFFSTQKTSFDLPFASTYPYHTNLYLPTAFSIPFFKKNTRNKFTYVESKNTSLGVNLGNSLCASTCIFKAKPLGKLHDQAAPPPQSNI